MMSHTSAGAPRIGVIFLGRKRTGFDPDWGQQMNARVREGLAALGLSFFIPTVKICDDASLAAAVGACREEGAEVLLALQTTMSDARLARTITQLWPDPVVLWATPENPQGDMISSCSLVGIHNWATNLAHQDHPFLIAYGAPENVDTHHQLTNACRLAATTRRLRSARVSIIGGQAPGFFHMAPDAAALQRTFGSQLQQFSLVQFLDVLNALDAEHVADDAAAVRKLGLPHRNSSDDDFPVASRLYLTMRHFFDNEQTDALGLRCWPELPNATGQWPYLGMVRLADEQRPVAPEGDGDGALLALIGQWLGFGASYLTDWLEHDEACITCWHAGNLPFSLSPPAGEPGGPVLAQHFNIDKPLVVESELPPDLPVTLARMWNRNGRYLLTAAEGTSVPSKRRLMGSQGLVKLRDRSPDQWFRNLCDAGMPHHILLFRGHHQSVLREFTRLTAAEWID